MEITNIENTQKFNISDLSFAELKIIRDACNQSAKGGVKQALEISQAIESAMENIAI